MEESGTASSALLLLVRRGQGLVAELFRLSDTIPPVFFVDTDETYAEILPDFRYFKAPEFYDSQLEPDPRLMEMEDEFRESHMLVLERLFQLFGRIVRYYYDLLRFVEDLKEGLYIQQSLDGMLADSEGKQLMIEAAYLHGTLLLLLDLRIDTKVKEIIVVCYFRYKGSADIPNVDDIIKLCRATGYHPKERQKGYPEQYFARFPLPRKIMSMIIGRLRMDDVYNQIRHYPNPEHRSRALSQQAGYLYVLLYFVPDVLHDETAVMREIVDKHFVDNWVVPFVTGHCVDLSLDWHLYPAAKSALGNVIDVASVKQLQAAASAELDPLQKQLTVYLAEGEMTDDYVLRNIDSIMGTVRRANVALQWMLLHATTRNKRLREAMMPHTPNVDQVVGMLLDVADVEFRLRTIYARLLDQKDEKWDAARAQAIDAVKELADFFSGSKVLSRTVRDDNLRVWFESIAAEVGKLEGAAPMVAGRKIQQLINALEEVESFHQFGPSLQTKQYLEETRGYLMDMVRVGNVTANVLATLAVVADFGFSFGSIIEAYNDQMHRRIRVDPFCVAKLRCLFLKLKSTMDLPLLRLAQCGGKDLLVVGEYYSQQLVNYVRAVLEVIPVSMFGTLDKIIAILTSDLKELPARLEKDKLKEYSQLGVRFRLAEATYEIAAFTQGILAMERTFVGVIEIDPRQILEDGIRKQLVQRIATIGHSELVFSHKQKSFFGKVTKTEVLFEERLASLAAHLEGLRRSLEYIQDYVNIYGLRVWQQEFQRIISFMVEQECNMFLKKQVPDWQSSFQSAAIPIPRFPPVDEHSVNFMGRLTRQLLQQTHPARTMYLYPLSGWFDGDGKEVVGIRMFSLLKESVGVLGLSGIDKLVCFMVVHRLQTTLAHYRARVLGECAAALSYFERHVTPLGGLLEGQEVYTRVLGSLAEGVWQPLLSAVVFIGHAQLLRRQIATEVASSCKMDSNLLSCTLETINESLLRDVRAHYLNPESSPFPGEESPLLPEISHYLTTTGIHNPISQIYVTTEPIDHLPALMFLFTLTQLPKYAYNSHFSVLAPRMERGKAGGKGAGTADACALIIGVLTVLRQFHSSHLQRYIQCLVQYIRTMLQPGAVAKDSSSKHAGQTTFSTEATTAICFLEDLARYGNIPREMLQMNVPPFIMDNRDAPE